MQMKIFRTMMCSMLVLAANLALVAPSFSQTTGAACPTSKPPSATGSAQKAIAIDAVTEGDQAVKASNAAANTTYDLFCWAKGAKPAVLLASGTAGEDGKLDFSDLSHGLEAGDVVSILKADDGKVLLDAKGECAPEQPNATVNPAMPSEGPRAIVGYEQSGANSADSAGRLYVDVYYGHALPIQRKDKTPYSGLRLFGDMRIGSSAQSSNATLGNFTSGIAGTAGSIKLNQIASVAEFLTGVEVSLVPAKSPSPDGSRLALFGEYGASGKLQAAELNNTFAFPANNTQAYTLLVQAVASSPTNAITPINTTCAVSSTTSTKIPGVADNCMFVEFAQQQPYFDQEGYVGLKWVSRLPGAAFKSFAPNIMSVGFGANHAVNQNMGFNAMRIEGLVPLAVPASKGSTKPSVPVIYLFGYANLAINHSNFPQVNNLNFISLNPLTSVLVNNVAQTPSASNTYVIATTPKPQEFYSIGVGVDLVNIWNTLFKTSAGAP